MAKTLTLKQTGYWVEGTAKLLLWGDDEGEVNMDPFHVTSLDEIPDKINDGQFMDGDAEHVDSYCSEDSALRHARVCAKDNGLGEAEIKVHRRSA